MFNTLSKHQIYLVDELGDAHSATSIETPMRPDAFVKSDEQKKIEIAELFAQIMEVMGMDLTDD